MTASPGNKKESREYNSHNPKRWGGWLFWSFGELLMFAIVRGLVTNCYWSWSEKKLNKEIRFRDLFLKRNREYIIEMMS